MNISGRLKLYVAGFAALFVVWLASPDLVRPWDSSFPAVKVAGYLKGRGTDRIVFAGDSRTFTDIQPRVVTPALGRKSYNLATFGLWLPSQYEEFQDVLPKVSSGTVIVWSMSHRNFQPVDRQWWFPAQYKFGLMDAAEFLHDGYPPRRVWQEYKEAPFSPFDSPLRLHKRVLSAFDRVLLSLKKPSAMTPLSSRFKPVAWNQSGGIPDQASVTKLIAELKSDPQITLVTPLSMNGALNSIETIRTDGGYDRIIVDPQFFREQQSHLWPKHLEDNLGCRFAANEVYLRTFHKILDLISRYHLRVIVNYIEDAPGSWITDTERTCARQFMTDQIAPLLRQHDIEYIAPDFYPLINHSNDWYFDESHLATDGAAIYSRFISDEIQKVLVRRGW